MARGRFYHDPARKNIEQYQDFSGGLNTVSSNENTRNNELTVLENIDLGERGSLKRRKGLQSKPLVYEDEGLAQGYWRYYRHYTPYNLIGIAGAFDEPIRYVSNGDERIGSWLSFNLHESEHTYKIEREEAANITVNPQFENGEEGWRLNIPADKGDARIWHNTDTEGAERVLYIHQWEGVKGYLGEYQQPIIPTMENEEFYAEVMVRRPYHGNQPPFGSRPNAPQKAHLGAYVFKEDGTTEYMFIHSDFSINLTWKKLKGYFKMPKGAKSVRFGLGMSDYTNNAVGCYYDLFHVRRKAYNTQNGAAAITSENIPDHNWWGGIGYNFDIEPNKYYIALVDYKSDPDARGVLEIHNRNIGLTSAIRHEYGPSAEWTTKYMKFQTYQGFNRARMNLYNRTYPSDAGTVFYDSARVYEITAEMYELIDVDPDYTGESLVVQFPYRAGVLKRELITEEIVAKGGKFYIDGVEKKVEDDIPIQRERLMEAVTYYNNMYIASGSGLLVYNGSTIAKVEPYKPTTLEQLYIGSNALEETPFEAYDEDDINIKINHVKFSHRYGVINEFLTLDVGVLRPNGTTIEYKFERRRSTDKQGYWFVGSDWSKNSQYTFSTDIAGEYQFRISVRIQNQTAPADEYIVPKYIIKPTIEEDDVPIDAVTLDTCNRILVHWDRLILYGDDIHQDIIYISDLQNPAYFPVNNTLWFENPRKERISSIVPYRDNLVVFTPSSIQALYGTNPDNYQRVILNTDVGCIADRGAQVVQNYIIFPSHEGIMLLKTVGMSETRSNVELIDTNIKDLVEFDENAVAYVRKNQYCIVYPSSRKQLRYYYDWGVWTQDKSPSLDIVDVYVENGEIFALGSDGRLLFDSDDYQDEGVPYTSKIATKQFNFGEPYAIKKTRELQLMMDEVEERTSMLAQVYLDVALQDDHVVQLEPGEKIYKMMIPGKGLEVRVVLVHEENKPFRLDGMGFVFKLKNP